MTEEMEELRSFLPGLTEDMPAAYRRLAEIFKHQVFELYTLEKCGETNVCAIPYMMNDAAECYLVLRGCRQTGEYRKEAGICMRAELVCMEENRGAALIVRQGETNVFTLWFSELTEVLRCYQYHRIGHFWMRGQEHWRRLAYILGTIHDKWEYLGEEACNDAERELLMLVEFPPLWRWMPVSGQKHTSRLTARGAHGMGQIAEDAGAQGYRRLIGLYEKIPCRPMEYLLGALLTGSVGERLCTVLEQKVENASAQYPPRIYGEGKQKQMQDSRAGVERQLHAAGFHGAYPRFCRENRSILVVEEHPFTVMEAEDFIFRIHLMVTEVKKRGFFKGRVKRSIIRDYGVPAKPQPPGK